MARVIKTTPYKITVRDYDLVATEYLLRRRDLSFERREVGEMIQFTVAEADGRSFLGIVVLIPTLDGIGGDAKCEISDDQLTETQNHIVTKMQFLNDGRNNRGKS